jgi:hypothetical protein
MMLEKGPGEGYMAAKDDVLALRPGWRCRRMTHNGVTLGYQVHDERGERLPYGEEGTGGERVGFGRQPRDAWGSALHHLKPRR